MKKLDIGCPRYGSSGVMLDKNKKFELDGPPNRFRTRDEAEDHALVMGQDWIDKKNPVP